MNRQIPVPQTSGGQGGGDQGGGGNSGSSDYVIYSSRGFEITGSAEINGNVSLLNGKYTNIKTGHKEFINGNLDVEEFEDSSFEKYKDENQVHVNGDINNLPFLPPVCCSDCNLFPSFGASARISYITVKNKENYTISNNSVYEGINVKNGGTLIINSGNAGNTLYIQAEELTISGTLKVTGNGRVQIKVTDNLLIKANGGVNSSGDPSQLTIIFTGSEFSEATGDVSAMLCFGPEVKDVKLTGNLNLDGAISAPRASFFLRGNISISKWMYGMDFDIAGNVDILK
jgi:hypothetical protein